MPGYQWKGTYQGPDLFDATTRPRPQPVKETKPARRLRPCGTRAAYKRHLNKEEDPCQPCKTAEATYKLLRRRRQLKPCGTMAAYKRHHRKKEPTCAPCRKAYVDYRAKHPRPVAPKPKMVSTPKPELKPCGTPAAYNRHLRKGEPACAPCRQAQADKAAALRGGRKPRRDAQCGTRSGYHRHKKRSEIPCEECRQANTEYRREYHERMINHQQAA